MTDLSYAYANARVKAMHSQLLDRDAMRALLDVKTLPEFIELLEESPYKQAFVSASVRYRGIELVKHALDADLVQSMQKVYKVAPAKAKPFLARYLQHWQVNNLKKILAAKAIGKPVEQTDLLVLGPSDARFLSPFLAAKDFGEAARALAGTEYASAAASVLKEYEKTHDFRLFLSALDDYHYAKLAEAAATIPDRHLWHFLRMRIDMMNAMAILRMRLSGMKTTEVSRRMLHAASRGFAQSLIHARSMDAALGFLSTHAGMSFSQKDVDDAIHGKSLSGIEVSLDARMLTAARRTMRMSVLSLGTLVGYLHLKEAEVHALRKIAYATQFEVKERIRATIVAPA